MCTISSKKNASPKVLSFQVAYAEFQDNYAVTYTTLSPSHLSDSLENVSLLVEFEPTPNQVRIMEFVPSSIIKH